MRLWLVVVALAVTSCKKKQSELEFHRLELPGFSIEAPTFVKAPAKLDYKGGDIQRQRFPGSSALTMITMTWKAGPILTTEEMPLAMKVLIDAFAGNVKSSYEPARSVVVAGQTATQLDAKLDKVNATFVDITCGKRSVMFAIATLDDFQTIRDRMLKSFVCKPIAAEEAKLDAQFWVGADDPKVFEGWRFADPDRSVMTITNDDMIVVFVETSKPDGVSLDQLRSVMPGLFGASGMQFTPDPDGRETRTLPGGERRIIERGSMTAEGEQMVGVMSMWACDEPGRAVLAMAILNPEIATKQAVDFITKVRCAKPGDPPLPIAPYVAEPEPAAD